MKVNLTIPQLGNRFVDYRQDIIGDSFNFGPKRKLSDIKFFFIHHSVTPQEGNWKKEADKIASLHVNGNGWAGVGYHFIIGSDGVVAYVQDISHGGASVLNHNEVLISACLVGDFTKHLPTDMQIHSAHDLIDFFLNNFPQLPNLSHWEQVKGHKDAIRIWGDTTATSCPGSSWPVDMYDRIKNNVPYTPESQSPTDTAILLAEKERRITEFERQVNEYKTKFETEQKSNFNLNDALEKVAGQDKDYTQEVLDAQHRADDLTIYLNALFDALGLPKTQVYDQKAIDGALEKIKVLNQPHEEIAKQILPILEGFWRNLRKGRAKSLIERIKSWLR